MKQIKRTLKISILTLILLSLQVLSAHADFIRMASTTSTQNSGLFDYLLPLYTKSTGIDVQVVAVGTGAALQLGKRGDVDLVLVHAKDAELIMVKEGWFVDRKDVMYNDFVIVGPASDPAGVQEKTSAADSFALIRSASLFVSRGDNSGTHKKELSIWRKTGKTPESKDDNSWYLSVGQGMAKTVRIAAQKKAYTMTDRGTWLALIDREDLGLAIVTEGDPALFNQYGAMAVNPDRHEHAKYKEAKRFIDWLVSASGQSAIGSFKNSTGKQLFIPNAR